MEKSIYYNKLLDKKGNNKVTRAVKKPDRKQKNTTERTITWDMESQKSIYRKVLSRNS